MIPRILVRASGAALAAMMLVSCTQETPTEEAPLFTVVEPRPEIYAEFTLTADLSHLTDNQREMIKLLIDASVIMDDLYWRQTYGDDYQTWLASIGIDEVREFAELNYGPWDRLDADNPFIDDIGAKPLGANFYPADMSKEEFDAAYLPGKKGLYSLLRRDETGELKILPYHIAYAAELQQTADILREAAKLADSPEFSTYLKLRAVALVSDEFQISDMNWMDMKVENSLLRRDETGELKILPYHIAYAAELQQTADILREAAKLADSPEFSTYLKLRAVALVSDEFQISDMNWMDMKDNDIDLVIGPIETYEDLLFGIRAAYESYVLVKDKAWSDRLSRYTDFLPALQEGLPVPDEYKWETPGTDSDLNAYEVIYYGGQSNAGSKTIAINLPNDEEVQLAKGTRRLQLKNAMQAKFDKILEPIADVLVDESQRRHVTFDAFFANTMFHEVAHGLGIKNTIDGSSTVREALLDLASSMEEGKADVLGLYMITELNKQGELGDVEIMDYYVTFMSSIFRSTRFGASSAHGKANMVRFNFFTEMGAFVRDPETGKYTVDFEAMQNAMTELSRLLLTLQGDGDYDGAAELTNTKGVIGAQLQEDLDRLTAAGIPVDIVFKQGTSELGLD